MKLKINKRGAEKIMAVYWFAILLIVAGGVFAMVYIFYNNPFDVRGIESRLLLDNVADCVSTGGYLNSVVYEENFEERFLEYCRLNFDTEGDWEEVQYYVKLEISKGENPFLSVVEGNLNIVSDCGIEGAERLSVCHEDEFYSLDSEGKLNLVKITSVVRKTEKNAKL